MDAGPQLTPPESELEKHESRKERGNSALRRGCLALIVIIFLGTAAVAGLFFLNRDDDSQTVSEADHETVVAGEAVTADAIGDSLPEPVTAEPEAEASSPQIQEPVEPEPTETPSPTPEPTTTPTPTSEPTPEPTDTPELLAPERLEGDDLEKFGAGRIAVVDGRSRLWTVASDGSDRRLLTGPGRFYQFPSWSPSGNEIAAIGTDTDGGGVYVLADELDSEISQLYADRILQPIYLYWSPEGDDVSFIANHSDGLALHLAPAAGSVPPQVLATSPSTFFWDWMPDSSQVLIHTGFTARNSDDSRLAFVPLDSALEPSEIAQRGFFQAPVMSASGRYYSYGDEDPTGRRWLNIWDFDNDRQVNLAFHQGVVAMGFSPTEPKLAYTSPEIPALSFYGPLRLIDVVGGESRLLVPETVLAFFWSPDGHSIAFLTLSPSVGPFEFEDAPVAGLQNPASMDRFANLSISGKSGALAKAQSPAWAQSPPEQETRVGLALSIVDVESGEIRPLTVFEPTTVFINQFLPFFDQYALSHRLWSPDSEALVLPMTDEQDRDFIVVVPADGSPPQAIARGVAAFWSQQ